jgi:2-polyprenyl-3-methyl-5-hydroxy-6-metoxy-1,4-benzoquinol methylase
MAVESVCPACRTASNLCVEQLHGYRIMRCQLCTLAFCDPMKAGDESYYEHHLVYEEASDSVALQQANSADNHANRSLLQRLPSGARLLDIGCGFGAFVAVATKYGLDAYGVDFNANQIEVGRRVYNLRDRLHVGRVEQLPQLLLEEGYDAVTMFEVIEHVEDPRALLESALRLLKPGGMLVISCPNDARWQPLGRIFVDYPPHHLTRWSPKSITWLMRDLGLEDIRVQIDSKFRDILWTAAVNRSAAARSRSVNKSTPTSAQNGMLKQRNWKHVVFDLAGVVFFPVDLILRLFGVGTMGMRVVARKHVSEGSS